VLILEQGNNLEAVIAMLRKAKRRCGKGKPVVILMKTEMGYGVDFMQGTHKWHGKSPNQEQFDQAMAQLPKTNLGDY
jgi:transketolase